MMLHASGTPQAANSFRESPRQATSKTLALLVVIVLCFACLVALARWMDAHRSAVDTRQEEESLYVSGAAAKRMSLSFNGIIADWYWMRALQYVGRKIVAHGGAGAVQLDNLGALDAKLLAPLLDATTTLDPQFIQAYEYGAVVLPSIDEVAAITLLQKGIAANPTSWRLYNHLGYINWQHQDYKEASDAYGAGAQLPGAPKWMQALSARMIAEGGSRQLAREMYARMLDEEADEQVREMAAQRLLQIESFDERDAIRRVLSDYAERAGRCPASWKNASASLRAARLRLDASGAPVDPANTPYLLIKDGCDVDLDSHSKVPYK